MGRNFYHVTSKKNRQSIKAHGLRPRDKNGKSFAKASGDKAAVWLWPARPTRKDDSLRTGEDVWKVKRSKVNATYSKKRNAYHTPFVKAQNLKRARLVH